MDNNQDNTNNGKYWKSLEQWRQDPEFIELAQKEFVSSPLQESDGQDGWARREFLKLMGASIALTSFGCVRRPAQKIIPYAKKPADIIHGIPNYYASSYVDGFEGLGIVVTTRDGRPIKIEGNTEHPLTKGGMSARAHAHILKLYDPDRFTGPKHNLQNEKRTNRETIGAKWANLDKAVIEQLKKGGSALLLGSHFSPSTDALIGDFAAAFGTKIYRYDDISMDAVKSATKASYGQENLPHYDISKAKTIVAINNDFLGTWLTPTTFASQFSTGRKADKDMNKLIVIESLMSLTGTNADRRYRIKPSQTLDVVMGLLHEIVVVKRQGRYAGDGGLSSALTKYKASAGDLGLPLSEIADELLKNQGQSLVLAGGGVGATENEAKVIAAANLLNSALGNDGKTVLARAPSRFEGQGIGDLLTQAAAGSIKTLIIHGSNPVYSLPESAKFLESMAKVEMIVYTGDRNDETARFADYVATDHNPLENWSDLQTADGSYCIQQPTIQPLFDTRAFQDSLLAWTKGAASPSGRVKSAATWYDFLKNNWRESIYKGGGTFEEGWIDVLQKGVVPAKSVGGALSFSRSAFTEALPAAKVDGFELALYQKIGLGDGSLANVPWMQEFPDPVTKNVWDNYACISPKDAKTLKIKQGQHVRITAGDVKIELPAHIQPGQADGVVGVAVGYGRKGAGRVADGVGQNAFQLIQFMNGQRVGAGFKVGFEKLAAHTDIACVQDHHSMEGRQIVVEETLQDHIKKPGGNVHRHHMITMWKEHEYKGHKWGMVIDLNSCTGCGSCIVACQSENNIPVVGKKYVLKGREMHWLRIDRYYVGNPENPDTVHQPIVCMHCDNAPCETVCPVAATTHSDEGTNDMIYNRCVGTRYCSNNCPYKVRRFNWFNYTDIPDLQKMALNPEVTVRFRGVMEKCTFCIHRIKFHKYRAKIEDRQLKDGDITTACQQSCPTGGIIFGDLNDPNSAVAKAFHDQKSYPLLEELNTRPAVHYQVKVRNVEELQGDGKDRNYHGQKSEEHHA